MSLKPHVIAHHVTGGLSQSKTNECEAEEVAALVLSCCEQPEYADKHFGVVSLVGDEQAYRIDSLLRKHLGGAFPGTSTSEEGFLSQKCNGS